MLKLFYWDPCDKEYKNPVMDSFFSIPLGGGI